MTKKECTIGELLRNKRNYRNLSQGDVVKELPLFVTQENLSRYETGKRTPCPATFKKLLYLYGCTKIQVKDYLYHYSEDLS